MLALGLSSRAPRAAPGGRSLLNAYPDGASLVEPGALADPALVPQAVGRGRRHPRGAGPEPLATTLHGRPGTARRLLLVLDNCEHLVDACARLADTLPRACPYVHRPGHQPGGAGPYPGAGVASSLARGSRSSLRAVTPPPVEALSAERGGPRHVRWDAGREPASIVSCGSDRQSPPNVPSLGRLPGGRDPPAPRPAIGGVTVLASCPGEAGAASPGTIFLLGGRGRGFGRAATGRGSSGRTAHPEKRGAKSGRSRSWSTPGTTWAAVMVWGS